MIPLQGSLSEVERLRNELAAAKAENEELKTELKAVWNTAEEMFSQLGEVISSKKKAVEVANRFQVWSL